MDKPGGLWRSRGRPPNYIFGMGSCAMGIGKGAGYGVGFILRGMESTDMLGEFGLVQGAASGDEIDRLDYGLGIPGNAVVVATTKLAEKIRSDAIYFETSGGGAVFSVGSINWVAAMA
ncbi:MAG: hypothetical protein Q9210_005188 [Variospora velana]